MRSLFIAAILFIISNCAQATGNSNTNVNDAAGNASNGSGGTNRRIFVMTPDTTQGNLGGAAGADTKCNNASNKPSGSATFKAIIVDVSRRACINSNCTSNGENLNWVLLANTKYYREDGATEIKTTNSAGIFTFPLTNSVSANSHLVYTGVNNDWTADAINNCTNWTNNGSGQNARAGFSDSTSGNFLGQMTISCDSGMHLLCAEQ